MKRNIILFYLLNALCIVGVANVCLTTTTVNPFFYYFKCPSSDACDYDANQGYCTSDSECGNGQICCDPCRSSRYSQCYGSL